MTIESVETPYGRVSLVSMGFRERGHRPTWEESIRLVQQGRWLPHEDDVATLTDPYLYRLELWAEDHAATEGYLVIGALDDSRIAEAVREMYPQYAALLTPFGMVLLEVADDSSET